MKEEGVEYFHGNKLEIEKEKQKKRELMSYFPKTLGTIDKTRYVLWDNDKTKQEDDFISPLTVFAKNEAILNLFGKSERQNAIPKKEENLQTSVQGIDNLLTNENILGYGNSLWGTSFLNTQEKNVTNVSKSLFDFENDIKEEDTVPFNQAVQHMHLGKVNRDDAHAISVRNRNFELADSKIENELDSLSYNDKGHMSVTFRNDVIGTDGFKAFDPTDRSGCKRRCMEMLAYSGCELSGERIDMTVNDENGRAISQSADFQKGINAINNALDKKQTIILNVDYKDGTAASADRAGDHFIIIVGRTIINGITYYHFYDPATQFVEFGTANTNVLYIKDGFLQGGFVKRNGGVNKYKVTSVRLNK